MKRLLIIAILILAALPTCVRAVDSQPVAMLFPVTAGSGAMPNLASEATQAVKTYFRESGKIEVMVFDPQSATVRRAIEEHRMKASDLVGVTTPSARLRVGKLVGVDYVVSGELTYGTSMKLNLWMAHVNSGQTWGFDGDAVVESKGKKELIISNAIQTAANRVVSAAGEIALKGVRVSAAAVASAAQTDPTSSASSLNIDTEPVTPAVDAGKHVELGDKFAKSGDSASAILEYRRAIDTDPNNVETRVKLAQLYESRKMFTQAQDELDRARIIAPQNEAVLREIEALKSAMADSMSKQKAETTTSPSQQAAPNVQSLILAGDAAWRKLQFDEAERMYRLAAGSAGAGIDAHDRLALLLLAVGKFDDAAAEVGKIGELDQNPDPTAFAQRYGRFQVYLTRHITAALKDYDSNASSFADKRMTREEYYRQMQSMVTRVESIIRFVDVLPPPEPAASARKHQSLGLSLLSQACAHMVDYLESNKPEEKDNAAMMYGEAKKQLAVSH